MATRRLYCSVCGQPAEVVGELSARGRCAGCATLIQLANTAQMRERAGPLFDHWRQRTIEGTLAAGRSTSLSDAA